MCVRPAKLQLIVLIVCDCHDNTIIDICITMCMLDGVNLRYCFMFIVVYIVYYVCFEERSKMGLSCLHYILFSRGEVSSRAVSYADRWPVCV